MAGRKFLGKIPGDPWESLARGSREVMASLWQAYLSEASGVGPKSQRFKVLRQGIEKAAGFKKIYQDWNNLSPEERATAWRTLIGAAKEQVAANRERCVRCGECCELGSPTLLTGDLALWQKEVLTWNEVYTLRPGEDVTSRDGKVATLGEERLKVRELPSSRQCWFYLAATRACRIHENRPEQCRRQNCWGEPAPLPKPEEHLSRRDLLAGVPEIWELITTHEERCALSRVSQALAEVDAGGDDAREAVFEALHFDHYLRQMLIKDWGLTEAATEMLLGRPLAQFLRSRGISASLTPEGVFRLEARPAK